MFFKLTKQKAAKIFCHKCGSEIPSESAYCETCGSKVS
ncbi:MAG: zinc-ribbon domain-containing protein [Candidatus Methanomethylicaceae archaeon]